MHSTIEELLEAVFSMQSVPRLRNNDQQDKWVRNTVMGPMGSGTKNDCAGNDQQKFTQNLKWVSCKSTVSCELALVAGG
jgi:hypothetical protein